MWLITEDGLTSVVRYVPTKDNVNKEHRALAEQSDDPKDWLIIRARVKADLERIEEKAGLDLHIVTDPHADYAYRGLCRTADLQKYFSSAIAAIDYDSHFKEVVRDRAPECAGRYSGMMAMWSTMAKWQDYSPYSGHKRTSTNDSGYVSYGSGYSWSTHKSASSVPLTGGSSSYSYAGKDLAPEFSAGDGSVSLKAMAGLIKDYDGNAKRVPADSVNNADDSAFELWVRAYDLMEARGNQALDDGTVTRLMREIRDEEVDATTNN